MTHTSTAIDFVMHPELLRSVIQRQAGSLSKAVLEAVMNSIDAGATRIDVDFDANYVTIKDDGKGFADANEIH
ncbi:ATP-binding protein, partial [Klebsiella pneumoniae]|uniref:ATP-binding protein n=1 Tax=Klebsiella pneumoniae TaxID=573 RepID=UPI00385405F0